MLDHDSAGARPRQYRGPATKELFAAVLEDYGDGVRDPAFNVSEAMRERAEVYLWRALMLPHVQPTSRPARRMVNVLATQYRSGYTHVVINSRTWRKRRGQKAVPRVQPDPELRGLDDLELRALATPEHLAAAVAWTPNDVDAWEAEAHDLRERAARHGIRAEVKVKCLQLVNVLSWEIRAIERGRSGRRANWHDKLDASRAGA